MENENYFQNDENFRSQPFLDANLIAKHTGLDVVYVQKVITVFSNCRQYHVPDKKTVAKYKTALRLLWEDPSRFSTLAQNEKEVIGQRFLSEGPIPSFKEVGEEMGLSGTRVWQIENTALKKLQKKK